MDFLDTQKLLALLERIAIALEEQSAHQHECNEMSKQHYAQDNNCREEWRNLQIQWHEESSQREIARQQAADKLNAEIIKQNEINRREDLARQDKWHQDQMEQAARATANYLMKFSQSKGGDLA